MMKRQGVLLASLMGIAMLMAACGGHDGNGSNPATGQSVDDAQSTTPQPAAFSCPAGYKKFDLADGTVPNADVSIITDDGIAMFTFRTPATGRTDVAVCLGKPDPVPAGVQADYVYELIEHGDIKQLLDRRLTLNFTTDVRPTRTPTRIEQAKITDGAVTYLPVIDGPIYVAPPNYSLVAKPNEAGLYVVRLTQ
ncbi:hypothetical protein [Paraburkholderia sp. SIMBA_030]|uniref:hypothetical protein n=1 Tax=Paraburkholderia sp. SIMBA_030 TaxID=3085773 RepID=UPI0039784B2B